MSDDNVRIIETENSKEGLKNEMENNKNTRNEKIETIKLERTDLKYEETFNQYEVRTKEIRNIIIIHLCLYRVWK